MIREPVWTRRLADELWSGAVTPLTFSLLAPPMVERMVRRPLRVLGLDRLAAAPVLHRHASHVYVNAELLADVIELLPGALRSEGLLRLLPAEVRARLGVVSPWTGFPRAAAIAVTLWLREPSWAPWARADAFDAACARVRARFAALPPPPPTAEPAGLHAELAVVRGELGDYLAVVSWGVVFAYVFYHLATELARRWAPDLTRERADLTVGLPGAAPLDAAREVRELGRRLAGEPALLATARDEGAAAAWRLIAAGRGPLAGGFRALLARHGHRLTGRDLLCPTWREAPEVVVGLALGSASGAEGQPRLAEEAAAAARRERATAAIERVLGRGPAGPARRAAFRAALRGAQRYYVLRENMRYHADYFLARLRALALALGNGLAADGRLGDPSDVCFLDFDELGAALARPGPLGLPIAERRAAFARDAATPPPPTLAAEAPAGARDAGPPPALAGEPAAPGRCRARARLVRGPADFAAVERGDVVVASYADPGWTPVLELAGGLVLEAGGQLSHGAIVARELGIPALVNVAGAIRVIRDGDVLDLDASGGAVTIVARA
jgi:phosphohistidine swiveling domain-containing protein